MMTTTIDRRQDVNPKEGLCEYGDVQFADPTNHKYPIDSEEHVRAAWSYINHRDNAAKYDKEEVRAINDRIKLAAKKHGVEIDADQSVLRTRRGAVDRCKNAGAKYIARGRGEKRFSAQSADR